MIYESALQHASTLLTQMGFTVSRAEIKPYTKHGIEIVDIEIEKKIPDALMSDFVHSVQTLVRLQVAQSHTYSEEDIHRVVIDINGHIAHNISDLETKVSLMANRAVTFGVNVHMDALNPFERKIAHSMLDSIPGIRNESIGFGRDRHIVIYPTQSA